jgi:hypothetical protein
VVVWGIGDRAGAIPLGWFALIAYDAACALAIWLAVATVAARRHQRFSHQLVEAR